MSTSEKLWLHPSVSKFQALNMIGEQLYPHIQKLYPKVAGKLTGMLLEGLSLQDLDELLTNETKRLEWIEKAHKVLQEHSRKN